ncbi:MAG: TonB-dependent receptor [Bacteroidales bacterium]|nr:TonB-dependent receptor [Bacteroidales bacterium]
MEKNKFYILILISFFSVKLKAQDTLQINEVVKNASFQNTFRNSNEELIDSTLQENYKFVSIDEILAIQTSSQIKSYGGLGNLSSISLRGSGANHVAINWNGFIINSATTGSTDLSLIQTGFFDEIKIIPGASSSLYGSGTFGGALELNNFAEYSKGLSFSTGNETGSFKTHKYLASTSFSNNNLQYKISFNKINAENNFPFVDNYKFDAPLEKRQHNSLNSFNIIQNIKLKLPKNNTLESGIWYVIKNKEIPEIAGSYIEGNKMQTDSIFRTYFRWKKLFKNSLLTVSSAYFSEYLHYTDKTNSYDTEYYINSEISAKNFANDISYIYYLKNNLILSLAGIINRQQVSTSNYFENKIYEADYSLISSVKYTFSGYNFKFNLRNEFSEQIKYIPLFDFGINKAFLNDKILISTNVSNKYRKPTFNERYWQPGGNINLNYETGNNAEISLKYFFNNKSFFNTTYYHSNINDMVQWIPKDNVWTAVNNKNVKINGIEININHSLKTGKFSNKIIASYNFTNALLTDVYSNDDYIIPQKLIYTPTNTAKFYFASTYKKFTISFATQYTGKRYITQENNEDYTLPEYLLSNIYASYNIDIKHFKTEFNLKFLNIFNKQYEMIKSFPSPGRSIYFSIILKFKQHIQQKQSGKLFLYK